MTGRSPLSRLLRAGAVLAVVAGVGSQIFVRTLGAYLTEASPQDALALGIGAPKAYFAVAEDLVRPRPGVDTDGTAARSPDGKGTPGSDDGTADQETLLRARRLAVHGLLLDPLDAGGWRALGSIDDMLGDREAASRAMASAARRSLREAGAHLWLLMRSYERKDPVGALSHAEVLLQSRSSALAALMPALVWIASTPEGKTAFDRVLAARPTWRDSFFAQLPQHVVDARLPLQLMLALKTSPNPPSVADVKPYLELLLRHKLFELANYTWLQFLPPAQVAETGSLFNGSFRHTPSGMPFDWVIEPGVGVTVDIVAQDDLEGQKALVVDFGEGRAELKGVHQQTMLRPGNYIFKGRMKGRLIARRGMQWRVACADAAGEPVGKSQLIAGTHPGWTDFSFTFAVPSQGCRSQVVALVLEVRSASERLVQGGLAFTSLRIERRSE